MSAVSSEEQATGLRDAAEVITGCAELQTPLYGEDGTYLGTFTKSLARPLALSLRASAELIQAHGSPLGLPVNFDLQIAGLVLGRDLGYDR